MSHHTHNGLTHGNASEQSHAISGVKSSVSPLDQSDPSDSAAVNIPPQFTDDQGSDNQGNEAQPAKVITRGLSNQLPTKEEREQHMLTHEPFRNWCQHCIRGKCVAGAHNHGSHEKSVFPTIHVDYCFLVKRHTKESAEAYDSRRGSPILVAYDDHSKSLSANFVPSNGCQPVGNQYAQELHGAIGTQTYAIPQ